MLASAALLYAFAVDREAQGEFDTRDSTPYDGLAYVQLAVSIAVGALIGRSWVLLLPLFELAFGWTVAYSVAEGHAAADVLISTPFVAAVHTVALGIGLVARRLGSRYRRRSQ